MPEPALIQQQRELLRAFRQATAQRAKAEADTEARRKADRTAADTALNQARQTSTTQLVTARQAQEQAQTALTQASLQHLLDQTRPAPPAARSGVNPTQELARCVSVATEVSTNIKVGIEALKRRREAVASWRRFLINFAVVILIILASLLAAYIAAIVKPYW